MRSATECLEAIGQALSQADIPFRFSGEALLIPLPNEFGTMEIIIWRDEEDSIQLLEGSCHTHGNIEAGEFGVNTREEGIQLLLRNIFSGKYKLVEISNEDGSTTKTIWDERQAKKYKDDGDFVYWN
ncbi:hypothetical protein [Shewanella chilikensis]|uniref:hypothetical protein n=1 Tax=Shewanella chilikensis TaxID=558541 RepID=UPI00300527EF